MVTYGINGIGRIGKFALKALIEREAKVSWINDSSGTIDLHRHLLEYDLSLIHISEPTRPY